MAESPGPTAPLALSALALNLVVVLSQRPSGSRANDLGRILAAPHTSVQTTLRHLEAHGLVRRDGAGYWLRDDHPAMPEVVALALRLPPMADALALVVRANEAIEFACVDGIGFIVGERRALAPEAWVQFERALAEVRRDRDDAPLLVDFATADLARMLHSAVGLRTRIGLATVL